jgi:hypothetical protein
VCRSTLVLSVLLLGSCEGGTPRATCPPSAELTSGLYLSGGDGRWQGGPGQPHPHDNHQPKTLRLDREAGRAQITYRRDGQEVVEVWRLVERESPDSGTD